MTLLNRKEAAARLRVSETTLKSLNIPVVRIGNGRGKVFYRPEDLDAYVNRSVEYSYEQENNGRSLSKRQTKVGLQGLLSRAHLHKIRLAHKG